MKIHKSMTKTDFGTLINPSRLLLPTCYRAGSEFLDDYGKSLCAVGYSNTELGL